MKMSSILLSGSALALGAFLLLAPQSHAVEQNSNLSPGDEQFIQREAAAGKAIIRIANEAATRGENENIRSLARSLVRDHEKSKAQLAELAESKGVVVESGDIEIHEAPFDQLRGEKGEAFDREFVVLMIKMHKDSTENFERTAADSSDADIKKWAAEMLPGLKAHLEKVKDLGPSKTASAELPHLIVL